MTQDKDALHLSIAEPGQFSGIRNERTQRRGCLLVQVGLSGFTDCVDLLNFLRGRFGREGFDDDLDVPPAVSVFHDGLPDAELIKMGRRHETVQPSIVIVHFGKRGRTSNCRCDACGVWECHSKELPSIKRGTATHCLGVVTANIAVCFPGGHEATKDGQLLSGYSGKRG